MRACRTKALQAPLVRFGSPERALPRPLRPLAPSPNRPSFPDRHVLWSPRVLPPVRFWLPRTLLRRVPLVPPLRPEADSVGRRACHAPRRCRPQGPCPSRRFWRALRHARDPCGPRHPPKHEPDASRPCSMPLASQWNCPTELSLPEEPYPLSRATCFLAGSLSDRRRRGAPGCFTTAFPVLSQLFARSTLAGA